MDSTNNNNNQLLFVSELKELRNELSAVKKRIDQLEDSHEKQQEKINFLERENQALKVELNHLNGNKEFGSLLKRKRTKKDQVHKEEIEESKSTSNSTSSGKKKVKTNNNNDNDDEVTLLSQYDNGYSFDSLSDDLLHKINEFTGNSYAVFGSITKRCRNIYDVKEYKLKKQTCVYGYGTVEKMLEYYLQKRKERRVGRVQIAIALIWYNRLDAIDWIIQLGDNELLKWVCRSATWNGRINILTRVFCKCNLAMLDLLLDYEGYLCYNAAGFGQLETLKWLRKFGAKWDASTFGAARDRGYDAMIQYLRLEGCPEQHEDTDEST